MSLDSLDLEGKNGKEVEIEKSQQIGLCFGVARAVRLLKEAALKYGEIEVLGAPAHNQWLINHLSQFGVKVIGDLGQLRGKAVAIPSHGVSVKVTDEIQSQKISLIDTTCPIVQKAQKTAQDLGKMDFSLVIFGDQNHPEVKGIMGWTEGEAIATLDADIGWDKPPRRLGILSQTTQIQTRFIQFVNSLITRYFPQIKELAIINTICPVTERRQSLAIDLAKRADLLIVVGGKNSANTHHLAETCRPSGVETHLIESAAELEKDWLDGKGHLGITSGTSTPEEVIQEIIQRLEEMLLL